MKFGRASLVKGFCCADMLKEAARTKPERTVLCEVRLRLPRNTNQSRRRRASWIKSELSGFCASWNPAHPLLVGGEWGAVGTYSKVPASRRKKSHWLGTVCHATLLNRLGLLLTTLFSTPVCKVRAKIFATKQYLYPRGCVTAQTG